MAEYELSLFEEIAPRSTRDDDKRLSERLSSKRVSSPGGNTIRDKIEAIKREVERNLSFLFDKVSECRTEEELSNYIDKMIASDCCAVDTETLGKNYFKDKIFGFSLSAGGKDAVYVPLLHRGYVTGALMERQLTPEQVHRQLSRLAASNAKILMHNAKFDIHMIYHNFGVMLNCYWDTMIASRLIHSSEKDHSLKYQYNVKVLGGKGKPYDFKSLFGGISPEIVPISTMAPYAAGDTFETVGLARFQKEELKNLPGIYRVLQLEMRVLKMIVQMEEDGVCVDEKVVREMSEKYTGKLSAAASSCAKELEKYQDKITRYRIQHPGKLSNPVNLSSPSQIAILIYDIIGMAELPKYGRGTGKAVLKAFKEKNAFCKSLADYRDSEKLVNGFINSIPNFILDDGKVHSDFVQVKGTGNTTEEDDESGADTGRFSCKDPNLQQIPSKGEKVELRKMFKASPGCIMFSSDYSQQEPRVLAQVSGDSEMISAYREGKDLYAIMASKIYKKSYEDCLEFYPEGTVLNIGGKQVVCKKKEHTNKEGKKRRSDTKSVLLGLMYGRGQKSIAEETKLSLDDAKALIDTFYQEFPNVKKWMNSVEDFCKKNGYVDTIYGRRRELPDGMLPVYAYKNKGGRPAKFNPLDFSLGQDIAVDYSVEPEVQEYYNKKLSKAFGWKAKEEVLQEARSEGIEIRDNSLDVARAMRQAVNTTIQGSSADMSKLAMVMCFEDEELKRLGFRILFPVHDEIIAEAPEKNAKRCGEILSQMMIKAAAVLCPSVPVKCDVEYMRQ